METLPTEEARLGRSDIRQELGQAIVSSDNSMGEDPLAAFERQRQYKALDFDLSLDETTDTERLQQELKSTLHNHVLEMVMQDALLGASQIPLLKHITSTAQAITEGKPVESELFAGWSDIIPSPYPINLRRYVELLTGVSAQPANKTAQLAMPDLFHKNAKAQLLHLRVREIHAHLAERGKAPPISRRYLLFEPAIRNYIDPQDCGKILRDELTPRETTDRFVESGLLDRDFVKSHQLNSVLFMSVIFAGSYAIEEKYPGISPQDVTRILLQNASRLGEASYPKLQDSAYMHIVAADEAVRGLFTEMVEQATVVKKMKLDDQDRLRLPIPLRSHGTCPINHVYKVDSDTYEYFKRFHKTVESAYDLALSQLPEGELSLATEFFIDAIILAEPFVNGRAHDSIKVYRNYLLGNVAAKLRNLRSRNS